MKRFSLALALVFLLAVPAFAQDTTTIPTPDNTPLFVMAIITVVSLLGNLYQAVLAHRSVPPQFVAFVINTLKQAAQLTPSNYDDTAVEVFENLVETALPQPTVTVTTEVAPAADK